MEGPDDDAPAAGEATGPGDAPSASGGGSSSTAVRELPIVPSEVLSGSGGGGGGGGGGSGSSGPPSAGLPPEAALFDAAFLESVDEDAVSSPAPGSLFKQLFFTRYLLFCFNRSST